MSTPAGDALPRGTSPERIREVGTALAGAILNICYHNGMLPGDATYPDPGYRGRQGARLALALGILPPAEGVKKVLTMMKEGDPIARIVNVFGDTVAEVFAPAGGMYFGLRALPDASTGDRRCLRCKVEDTRD